MKKTLVSLCTLAFISQVDAVSVIVHPSNADSLDQKTVARIFQGKVKSFPSGGQVVPINQVESSAATESFNAKVLNKSASQMKAYWSKLVFTGKGQPPKEVANDAEVIALIAANPNMIGYIEGAGDGSVKVVANF